MMLDKKILLYHNNYGIVKIINYKYERFHNCRKFSCDFNSNHWATLLENKKDQKHNRKLEYNKI